MKLLFFIFIKLIYFASFDYNKKIMGLFRSIFGKLFFI